MPGREFGISRAVLLLMTLTALVLHVCALDAVAREPSARLVPAVPTDADSGHAPDVHAASCDATNPGTLGFIVVAVSSRPGADASAVETIARPTIVATPVPVPRPLLFLLHASLLI